MIDNLPPDHRDRVGMNGAFIDDRSLPNREMVGSCKEVGITDVSSRRVQLPNVDDRMRAKNHARGIGEINRAISHDLSIDLGWIDAVNSIENAGMDIGQDELDRFIARHIKARVVDDRVIGGNDRGMRAILSEFCGPGRNVLDLNVLGGVRGIAEHRSYGNGSGNRNRTWTLPCVFPRASPLLPLVL